MVKILAKVLFLRNFLVARFQCIIFPKFAYPFNPLEEGLIGHNLWSIPCWSILYF